MIKDKVIKLSVSADTHKQFKILCASEGITMNDKLLEYVNEQINKKVS